MTLKKCTSWLATGFLLSSLSCAVSAANGNDLNKLRDLVEGKKFAEAYDFAASKKQLYGHVQFDFLFGLAALNSGHVGEGLMALERHLSAVPANDRARLELARGYYELEAYPRARREFEFVLRYNPPEDVKKNIERYLAAMDVDTGRSSQSQGGGKYVEISAGYDSNVNAGTFNDELLMISGVEQIDDPNAQAQESEYASLKAGGQWMKRVDEKLSIYAGLDLSTKHAPQASQFDIANVAGYTGFSVLTESGLYKLSLSKGQLWVDNQQYRGNYTLSGEYQYRLSGSSNLNTVLQYAEVSHADSNVVRDANISTFGLGFSKELEADLPITLRLQASVSTEHNLIRRLDLDKDMAGVQFNIIVKPSAESSLDFGYSAQTSEYGDVDVAFGTVREDDMTSGSIAFNYLMSPRWLASFRTQYLENDSNQMLYEYRRWMSTLSARYLF